MQEHEEQFVDAVDEALEDLGFVDAVEQVMVPGHEDHETFTNDFGVVYCVTCGVGKEEGGKRSGITIGSVNDNRDALCPNCDHFWTCHDYDTKRCLMEGCPCGRR